MRVIALRGPENSGKSHVINIVYHFLIADGFEQIPGYYRVLGNPDFEDIIDVLVQDDFKIGFVGMGDYQRGEGSLRNLLDELNKAGCNIAICACRNKEAIERAVTQYESHDFVDKTITSDPSQYRIVNVADAIKILDLVSPGGIEHFDKQFEALPEASGGEEADNILPRKDRMVLVDEAETNFNLKNFPFGVATGGIVSLFYGTNRIDTGIVDINEKYGSEGDKLIYGTCTVSIPPNHEPGVLERPKGWWIFTRQENQEKDIVLQTLVEQTEADFYQTLTANMAQIENKSALLFIHGYNNSFADAARRCAQLACDLPFKGLSGFYSWPSSANGADYPGDEARTRAARPFLEKFIKGLITVNGIKKLHIIAHSMGNLLLTTTLENLSVNTDLSIIHQIILAAPDIDAGEFRNTILPQFAGVGRQRTLYASEMDMALQLSGMLRDRVRLGDGGDALFIDSRLNTIDASSVPVRGLVKHGYIFEAQEILTDLFYLFDKEFAPEERRLREIPRNPFKYWLFP